MNIYAVITARKGSQRVIKKNTRNIGGKALIDWTFEASMKSANLSRIMLSTNDEECILLAKKYDRVEVPFVRPDHLSDASAGHVDVIEHLVHWLREKEEIIPDYILTLQPTSPLRTELDIDGAIALLSEHKFDAVVSATPIRLHLDDFVFAQENGIKQPLLNSTKSTVDLHRINGAIFLNQTMKLLQSRNFLPEHTRIYEMPAERSVDIDTEYDFEIARMWLEKEKQNHAAS